MFHSEVSQDINWKHQLRTYLTSTGEGRISCQLKKYFTSPWEVFHITLRSISHHPEKYLTSPRDVSETYLASCENVSPGEVSLTLLGEVSLTLLTLRSISHHLKTYLRHYLWHYWKILSEILLENVFNKCDWDKIKKLLIKIYILVLVFYISLELANMYLFINSFLK